MAAGNIAPMPHTAPVKTETASFDRFSPTYTANVTAKATMPNPIIAATRVMIYLYWLSF
jgi:hypothetical protein